MVRVKAVDWAKRYQELREAEWQARMEVLEFAGEVLRRWMAMGLPRKNGHRNCAIC